MLHLRKKKGLWLVAMACILFQISCQSPSKNHENGSKIAKEASQDTRRVLRVNIGSEPRTLDPAKARDLQSITMVRMLFEGLTRIDQKDKVEMALAKDVVISEDLKTYTFTLRDAKWTNGEAIVAEDFVYAWRRVLDPKTPADNAFQLYPIKNAQAIKSGEISIEQLGVKVLDEYTLQIELEKPTPYFLELTSYPVYFPINAKVDCSVPHWLEKVETFVSNGPFVLKEWKSQDSIQVEKNSSYWDCNTVKLDGISMYMLQEAAELSMFESKEIDWAGSPLSVLPIDALGKLHAEKMLNKKPILGTYFLRINTENALLSSSKMRRALSLSVNRDELVEHALAGSQVAATGFVPEVFGLHEESYFKNDDTHQAKKLFDEGLEEISMTLSKLPEIELLFPNSERNQRIAQMLQERWQRVFGVTVALVALESKAYLERLYKGDFQIAVGSWMADYNDPLSFLEIFKSKTASANHTHWENAEYTKLLENSSVMANSVERMQLLSQCEKILMEDMPIVPLFHYNLLFVKNHQLNDVFISKMGGLDFRWAHVDSSKKEDER
ncbi:MAG: peptide ABC transporter substrate-binding protein [Simkania sp.]|nr:peptide ABC transporter substrate-binding protein [Simkania sp.]